MKRASLVVAILALCACSNSVDGQTNGGDNGPANDDGPVGDTDPNGDDGQVGTDDDPIVPAEPLTCPGATGSGNAPNGSIPGALTFPSPTIRNVTIEWAVGGDSNTNGVVDVRFRKQGTTTWRAGLPLTRVPAGNLEGFAWASRHSGSLFDLEAATTYDVQARLLDADGGCEVRTSTVTTRLVPAPGSGTAISVTPETYVSVLEDAEPGDVIEFAAGSYDGVQLSASGTSTAPITLRTSGAVTIDGDMSLIGTAWVYVTGFTVTGRVRLNGTQNVSIVRNTVLTATDGIVGYLRSENDYIADNTITGVTAWTTTALGVDGDNIGEGILLSGPGHVIEHNRVSGFRDCISLLEDDEAVDQYSIDIVENDLGVCADDGIEADFCFHNCRIVRNRMTNVFMAMSSQPSLGGPTYFIRNVAYNVVLSAFKLQRSSIGDVVLHNTVVKNGDALGIYTDDVFARQVFRNNIFIGGPGGTYNGYNNGTGRVTALAAADPSGNYDYDAFGSTTGDFEGRIGATTFDNLAEMRASTTEAHAVNASLSAFAATVAYPTNPFPALSVADVRLVSGSAPVDAGIALANVNDGAVGTAPDCGAIELGAAAPAYGPR